MRRGMTAILTTIGLGILLVAGMISAETGRGDEEKNRAGLPASQAASDQAEAIRLAREVDLPALEKADRVVIQRGQGRGGARVELDDPEAIMDLRQALKPKEVPPSGGVTTYRLAFYRGETPIRKIWVFENGEWGFEREKGTSWTIGRDAAPIQAIKGQVTALAAHSGDSTRRPRKAVNMTINHFSFEVPMAQKPSRGSSS